MRRITLLVLLLGSVAVSCGDAGDDTQGSSTTVVAREDLGQQFPDVIAATATRGIGDAFRFSATISSPYDTPDRYADAWRIVGPDGTVYGVRELLHDHASEQPFTRSLDGVAIPLNVTAVTIEARDQVNGWGGATVDVVILPPEVP